MRIDELKTNLAATLTPTAPPPPPINQDFVSLGELLLRVQCTPDTTMQQAADCLLSWGLLMGGAPAIMINSKTRGIIPADKNNEKLAIRRLEFVFHRGHFESDGDGAASIDYELFGFDRKEFNDFLSNKVGEPLDLLCPLMGRSTYAAPDGPPGPIPKSLCTALTLYFDNPPHTPNILPEHLQGWVRRVFIQAPFGPGLWDELNPDGRRRAAAEWDEAHTLEKELENSHWFNLGAQIIEVKRNITEWELMSHHGIPSEAISKENKIIALRDDLAELEQKWEIPFSAPTLPPASVLPVSPPQPAPASRPGWTLKKPRRFQGYGLPLYGVLKAAHTAGLPRPTARFVLDEFAKNTHPVILCVSSDSMDYQNGNGEKVTADLDAIRAAIRRLARIADDSDE